MHLKFELFLSKIDSIYLYFSLSTFHNNAPCLRWPPPGFVFQAITIVDIIFLPEWFGDYFWVSPSFLKQRLLRVLLNFLCHVIFTVRNEVAKVMFLHLSVCPQGGCASVHAGIPPPGADTPWRRHPPAGTDTPLEQTPPADGYCCGRFASYWNAFLWISFIENTVQNYKLFLWLLLLAVLFDRELVLNLIHLEEASKNSDICDVRFVWCSCGVW